MPLSMLYFIKKNGNQGRSSTESTNFSHQDSFDTNHRARSSEGCLNLNSLLRPGVAGWTFDVWFHAFFLDNVILAGYGFTFEPLIARNGIIFVS